MLRTSLSAMRPPTAAGQMPFILRNSLRVTKPSSSTPLRDIGYRAFSKGAKPSTGFTFSSNARPSRPQTILQRLRASIRSLHTSPRLRNTPNPTPNLGAPAGEESLSLGARMRKLSREYGWSALGVYLMLSALDFPFCYLLVRYLGTDRIGEWEDIIVSHAKAVIPESVKETWHEWRRSVKVAAGEKVDEGIDMAGWGVEEAAEHNKRDASLATQLALAYAIHKSFIFIRVPLTAAVTPKVVKILRGWGWDIGKRTTKEAKAIKRAANPPKPKKK
ncbi:peptide alpha-N-acetyltransferase Nat2 [Phlyctema vagabunda]|uniref:Peptide alpha-N-acetyltransferase Nat2 n=1 Tax=Phlyctema vagabunda TaxID=108571 RepID=A0ABR4PR24_9HELO